MTEETLTRGRRRRGDTEAAHHALVPLDLSVLSAIPAAYVETAGPEPLKRRDPKARI